MYESTRKNYCLFLVANNYYRYNISNVYGLLGDKNSCINALRNAVTGGYYNYPFMLKDYFFDSVREEPEFKEVLALAKEKHEAFKKKFFPDK